MTQDRNRYGLCCRVFVVLCLSLVAPACGATTFFQGILLAAGLVSGSIEDRVQNGASLNEGDWFVYRPEPRSLLPRGEYQFMSSTLRQDKREDHADWLVVRWRMRNTASGPVDIGAAGLTLLAPGPPSCQMLRADPERSSQPVTVPADRTSDVMKAVFALPAVCSQKAPLLAPSIDRRGLDPEWATGNSALLKTVETSERSRFQVRLKPEGDASQQLRRG